MPWTTPKTWVTVPAVALRMFHCACEHGPTSHRDAQLLYEYDGQRAYEVTLLGSCVVTDCVCLGGSRGEWVA